MKDVQSWARKVMDAVRKVIIGKENVIERVIISLLARGHVLLEDIPGVGKTTLAKAIARSLGCTFKRIQCTPDLLPSDIIGTNVYLLHDGKFVFRPGPIFANIVLADEVNRASPKTQSSLLECMDEYQVTVDGVTYQLPLPFFLIATQNPIEPEGVFILPESQVDRFCMRLKLGYPDAEEEKQVLVEQRLTHPLELLQPVTDAQEVLEIQRCVREVFVSDLVYEYVLRIIHQTRKDERLLLGASPRGSLFLIRAAQARAAMYGRDYVIPDDIKALAIDVLAHRIIVKPIYRAEGLTGEQVIAEILELIPVPDMI
ncbi:MAG: MoxR family ATPase [Armatimonadota bacterium]|nr:MoxR family ATPase [Armatimonadota bacterium]MCX7778460.1 MoxR family ATPase [Armatimonadota bacterium]MDW8026519.1 MoxR family ATPase [Armatimonadota bacterium]